MGQMRQAFDFLRRRKINYQLALTSPAGQEVLRDLAKFCRADESAATPGNHDLTMVLVGRREVWLRIQKHLNLTPDQLYALYTGHNFNPLLEDKEPHDE